jgi:uncharacterized protein
MSSIDITTYIIKTVDGCNLGCQYCYVPFNPWKVNTISLDLIKKLMIGIGKAASTCVQLVWHGGEPLLAKQDFFETVLDIQGRYIRPDQTILHSIQTNATLLNDSWIDFLTKNNFGIGISLDGPAAIHDSQRPFRSSRGSHNKIINNIKYLKEKQINFGVSTVVTIHSVRQPKLLYDYFKQFALYEYDLLPCLPYSHNGASQSLAVDPLDFSDFLNRYFDIWLADNDPRVQIRFLVEIVKGMLKRQMTLCKFMPTCAGYSTLLINGDIYPCDSYAGLPEYCFGNLNQTSLAQISRSQNRLDFIATTQAHSPQCQYCRWFSICRGGCPFHQYTGSHYYSNPQIFCESYQMVFDHIYRRLQQQASIHLPEGRLPLI